MALVGPIAAGGPRLSTSHPVLADRISALGEAADEIRDADRDGRTSTRGDDE